MEPSSECTPEGRWHSRIIVYWPPVVHNDCALYSAIADEPKGDHEDYKGQRDYHVTLKQAHREVQRIHYQFLLEWV